MFHNSCYLYVSSKMNWEDAMANCRSMGELKKMGHQNSCRNYPKMNKSGSSLQQRIQKMYIDGSVL